MSDTLLLSWKHKSDWPTTKHKIKQKLFSQAYICITGVFFQKAVNYFFFQFSIALGYRHYEEKGDLVDQQYCFLRLRSKKVLFFSDDFVNLNFV